MPNRYAWLALGIGAYLAFALSLLPAGTAYRLFAPPELRLAGVDGTVWSGRAALGSAAGLALHDISWNLAVLPLFTARAAGHVQARLSDGFVDADVSASPSRVVLRNVRASTSVAALSPLVPLDGVRGLLSLELARVELRDAWPVAIVGRGRIGELAVPPLLAGEHAELIPLGSYELTFNETDGAGLEASFRDTSGPLEVAGTLSLDPQRRYRLEGVAAARPNATRELVQGLQLMTGEPRGDGKSPFELSGSL